MNGASLQALSKADFFSEREREVFLSGQNVLHLVWI